MLKRSGWLLVLAMVWIVIVIMGFRGLSKYETSPGTKGETPVSWPTQSQLMRVARFPTLVMFAHPQCPCTQASLNEFSEIVVRSNGMLDAHLVFFKPEGASDEWGKSSLWKDATRIPGVIVHLDEGNKEAAYFGVQTSGHTLLYDKEGRLLFTGGLTEGRGVVGESHGSRTLAALLNHSATVQPPTSVYGCSLLNTEIVKAQ
jgi:hypothetical protein